MTNSSLVHVILMRVSDKDDGSPEVGWARAVRTCLERLSLVWACWGGVCWVWASERACPALLSRVWGWFWGGGSVEHEALEEVSSTDAVGEDRAGLHSIHSYTVF